MMVGATGFEPATSCSRSRRSTGLSYAPPEFVHQLIANHARHTHSERARKILAAWNEYLPKFRKVMPVEYRRALSEMRATEVAVPPLAAAGA